MPRKKSTEAVVKDIKRKTRRKYSSEEKIRIVLEGLRGETTIAELCRREGIIPNVYYTWSREFLEAGKSRLEGNTLREANTTEIQELKKENQDLKELVAEISLENKVIKKNIAGLERGHH